MVIKRISRKPPRWDQDNSIYFLTFCTFDRKRYLHRPQVPEMIIENMLFYSKYLKELIAYTVMPNHIHLLVKVEEIEHLSDFLRDFKKRTSKEIKKMLEIKSPHIWQRGTMDHCIRISPGNEDYANHLNYIFYNSVKHLRAAPQDFAYHNFKDAVQKGWIEEDFGGSSSAFPKTYEMYE